RSRVRACLTAEVREARGWRNGAAVGRGARDVRVTEIRSGGESGEVDVMLAGEGEVARIARAGTEGGVEDRIDTGAALDDADAAGVGLGPGRVVGVRAATERDGSGGGRLPRREGERHRASRPTRAVAHVLANVVPVGECGRSHIDGPLLHAVERRQPGRNVSE